MKKTLNRYSFKILKALFVLVFCGTLISATFLAFSTPAVRAAEGNPVPLNFTPQLTIPNSDFTKNASITVGQYDPGSGTMTSDLLVKYVKAFYQYGLGIAGILAAIVLMAGGVLWLTSAGNDTKIGQAKELIGGSITGVAILFCSWIILNTINPDLVNLKPIVTKNIGEVKTISYCSIKNGNIEAVKKDNNYYLKNGEKIEEQGEACATGEACINMYHITNGKDGSFKCVPADSLKCCQYTKNNTTGITCLETINDCPAENNGNKLFKFYPKVNCDYQFNNSGRNPCVKN